MLGVTLTIKPGTTIYVAAHQDFENLLLDSLFDLKIGTKEENNTLMGVHYGEPYRDEGNHISIIVHGTLDAVGTSGIITMLPSGGTSSAISTK